MFGRFDGTNKASPVFNKLEIILCDEPPSRQVARNLNELLEHNSFGINMRQHGGSENSNSTIRRLERLLENDPRNCQIARSLCDIFGYNSTTTRNTDQPNDIEGTDTLLYQLEHVFMYDPPSRRTTKQLLRLLNNRNSEIHEALIANCLRQILNIYSDTATTSGQQKKPTKNTTGASTSRAADPNNVPCCSSRRMKKKSTTNAKPN